jgi:DNA polymerase I-like protein with 3'-5' exonuclease and polymerase domains
MLVGFDLAQLEWRTAAELSGDPIAFKEISEGLDTHSLNQVAFDLPSRLIAKIYLFRTIFRGSGYAFANDPAFMHVSSSPKFWDDVGEKFYKKYWRLNEWHFELADLVGKGLPIIGPTGREWKVDMTRDRHGNLKLPFTVFTNYPVQGTGADVMMIFRISFWRRFCALGLNKFCQVISTVHDSLYIDCPKEYVEQVVKLLFEVLDDLVFNIRKVFKYDWKTPLSGEVSVGPNQKDMKTVDKDFKYL